LPTPFWLLANFNYQNLFDEVLASLIEEEMSLGDMMTLLKLRRGQYSLVEEKIPAGAKAVGMATRDRWYVKFCVKS
jgi:trk system potassium uptake protein TrkA